MVSNIHKGSNHWFTAGHLGLNMNDEDVLEMGSHCFVWHYKWGEISFVNLINTLLLEGSECYVRIEHFVETQ